MAKKKTTNEETNVTKNNKEEKGGIIVLNEGKSVNEELNILGTTDGEQSITIDTSHLDEELGIAEVFKESGIDVMHIGNKKDKKNKKGKENKTKMYIKEEDDKVEEEEEEEERDIIKDVLDTFSMVLRRKEYEPIPYPFKNDDEFNASFEEVIELVDHMAISKFSRSNPELTLRDAYKHVFTIPEDVQGNDDKKVAKGITTKEVAVIDNKVVDMADNELEVKDVKEVSKFEAKLKSVVNNASEEFETILTEVLKHDDKEPEVVLEVLLSNSKKLEETSLGKLIKVITGESISNIIRAVINDGSDIIENIENQFIGRFKELEDKLKLINDKLEKDDLSDDEFIAELISLLGVDNCTDERTDDGDIHNTTEEKCIEDEEQTMSYIANMALADIFKI